MSEASSNALAIISVCWGLKLVSDRRDLIVMARSLSGGSPFQSRRLTLVLTLVPTLAECLRRLLGSPHSRVLTGSLDMRRLARNVVIEIYWRPAYYRSRVRATMRFRCVGHSESRLVETADKANLSKHSARPPLDAEHRRGL